MNEKIDRLVNIVLGFDPGMKTTAWAALAVIQVVKFPDRAEVVLLACGQRTWDGTPADLEKLSSGVVQAARETAADLIVDLAKLRRWVHGFKIFYLYAGVEAQRYIRTRVGPELFKTGMVTGALEIQLFDHGFKDVREYQSQQVRAILGGTNLKKPAIRAALQKIYGDDLPDLKDGDHMIDALAVAHARAQDFVAAIRGGK